MASLKKIDFIALAGGKGSRLATVMSELPKPLAVVAGRAVIEYTLDLVRAAGGEHVVLSLGHRAEEIMRYFKTRADDGLRFTPVIETGPLDTGGAIRFALSACQSDPVMVFNVDSYLRADFAGLLRFHRGNDAVVSLLATGPDDVSRSGALCLNADGAVTAFNEKGHGSGWINAGIYAMDRAFLETLPTGRRLSLEKQVFPEICDGRLQALKVLVPFLDIGTPETFAKADDFFTRIRGHQSEHDH